MPPYNIFFDSCNFQVNSLFKRFENLICKLQAEEYFKNMEEYFCLSEKNNKLYEKKLLKNE